MAILYAYAKGISLASRRGSRSGSSTSLLPSLITILIIRVVLILVLVLVIVFIDFIIIGRWDLSEIRELRAFVSDDLLVHQLLEFSFYCRLARNPNQPYVSSNVREIILP